MLLEDFVARFSPPNPKRTMGKYGFPEFKVLCPSHTDKRPTLSITVGDKGHIILHCWASCTPDDILGAAGLSRKNLWPDDGKTYKNLIALANKPGAIPFKPRTHPLMPTLVKLRFLAWVLHLYGADRIAGRYINPITLGARLTEFWELIPRLEHAVLTPACERILELARQIPSDSWNKEAGTELFNRVIDLQKDHHGS